MPHDLGISGRRNLEQNELSNFLPSGYKLPRNFKCQDSAVTMSAQDIRPFRTHRSNCRAVVRRVFLKSVYSPIREGARVANDQERLIPAEALGEIQEIIRV